MSTYSVDIVLGEHSFTISSADAPPAPGEPLYVLDGLRLAWQYADNDPFPSQPQPAECDLAFYVDSVSELADVDLGTPVVVYLTSAGTNVATFTGRVAAMSAVPSRRKGVTGLRYSISCVDYMVDLRELQLNITRPVETGEDRLGAIVDAIADAGGPEVTLPAVLFEGTLFDAITAADTNAFDLLDDHLRQIVTPDVRSYMVPVTVAGVLDSITCIFALAPRVSLTWPPGLFVLNGNLLTVEPDDTPPADLAGYQMGMLLDSGRVREQPLTWSKAKNAGPNTVTVTGPAGTVTSTSASPGTAPVKLAISTTLTTATSGIPTAQASMSKLYLPDPDANRWSVDQFVWMPTDAELAALPFCLTPDTDSLDFTPDHYAGPACYTAQVVVTNVPDHVNPASDSGFYAGCPAGIEVRVQNKTVTVAMRIAKRLPRTQAGFFGAAWSDLAADFPAVKWATGTQTVDPNLSWYETRLAREPV